MAAVNANEIEAAYFAAERIAREENDGRLDAVTEMALQRMAIYLLESLVSEAKNYKTSAERRILQGESALARLGYDNPEGDDSDLFTGGPSDG